MYIIKSRAPSVNHLLVVVVVVVVVVVDLVFVLSNGKNQILNDRTPPAPMSGVPPQVFELTSIGITSSKG